MNLEDKGIIEPRLYDIRDNPIKFYQEEDLKEAVKELRLRVLREFKIPNFPKFDNIIKEIFGDGLVE